MLVTTNPVTPYERQLDIIAIVKLLWVQKFLIGGIIMVAAVASVWVALTQDEIYMVELKAVPSQHSLTPSDQSLQATLALRLSGLGGATGEYEKHLVAVQILRSNGFLHDFIERHQLSPLLYGVKAWQPETNTLLWHEDIYDPDQQQWQLNPHPTNQDATQKFRLDHLLIEDNRQARILTLRLYHHSPIVAARWAEQLLADLNAHMQQLEISKLEQRLAFYQQQLPQTAQQDARQLLLRKIEEETFELILARSASDFMFEVIEPPMIPEKRAYPRRGLLVIIGTFLGGIFALVVAFVRALVSPKVRS